MLGSVARKLRIFGFDTLYVAHVEDSEVLKIGVDQDRIILTADKEFFKRIVKVNAKGVLVGGSDEFKDLVHIMEKNGIKSIRGIGAQSRCSICNGQLSEIRAEDVRADIPERIALQQEVLFKCTYCSKLYWEGSHVKRLRILARAIDTKLGAARYQAGTGRKRGPH